MILNKLLNKKQLIVGWVMIGLVSAIIIRTIFVLPLRSYLAMKTFFYLYFFIFIFGLLLIYSSRDSKEIS